jgi:hypothetical protein
MLPLVISTEPSSDVDSVQGVGSADTNEMRKRKRAQKIEFRLRNLKIDFGEQSCKRYGASHPVFLKLR